MPPEPVGDPRVGVLQNSVELPVDSRRTGRASPQSGGGTSSGGRPDSAQSRCALSPNLRLLLSKPYRYCALQRSRGGGGGQYSPSRPLSGRIGPDPRVLRSIDPLHQPDLLRRSTKTGSMLIRSRRYSQH